MSRASAAPAKAASEAAVPGVEGPPSTGAVQKAPAPGAKKAASSTASSSLGVRKSGTSSGSSAQPRPKAAQSSNGSSTPRVPSQTRSKRVPSKATAAAKTSGSSVTTPRQKVTSSGRIASPRGSQSTAKDRPGFGASGNSSARSSASAKARQKPPAEVTSAKSVPVSATATAATTAAAAAGAAAAAAAAAVAAATKARNAAVATADAGDKIISHGTEDKELPRPVSDGFVDVSPPALIADLGGTLGGDGQSATQPSGFSADQDSLNADEGESGTTGGNEVAECEVPTVEVVVSSGELVKIEQEAITSAEFADDAVPTVASQTDIATPPAMERVRPSAVSQEVSDEVASTPGRLSVQDVEALCAENQRLKEEVERQRQQIEVLHRMNQAPGSSSSVASPGRGNSVGPSLDSKTTSQVGGNDKPLSSSVSACLDMSVEDETAVHGKSFSTAVSDAPAQAGMVRGPPNAPVTPASLTPMIQAPRVTSAEAASAKASLAAPAGLLFANGGTLTPRPACDGMGPGSRAGAHSVPVPRRFVSASPAMQETHLTAGGYPQFVIRPSAVMPMHFHSLGDPSGGSVLTEAASGRLTPRCPPEYAGCRDRSLSPVSPPGVRMVSPFVGPSRASGGGNALRAALLGNGTASYTPTMAAQAVPMAGRFLAATPMVETAGIAASGSISPRLVRPHFSFRAATAPGGAQTSTPGFPTANLEMPLRPSTALASPLAFRAASPPSKKPPAAQERSPSKNDRISV